jgi:U3 small nucleolar RNA-associated protein 7
VPGSGEPNIDSNVANPFATAEWRQEQEVRGLLDKIPWDMITMEEGGPIKVGRPKDRQKERAANLAKHRMIKQTADEPKASGVKEKRVSMEKRLQMMKQEYNKQKLEEKLKKAELEKQGILPEEPTGPLARFVKAKQPKT